MSKSSNSRQDLLVCPKNRSRSPAFLWAFQNSKKGWAHTPWAVTSLTPHQRSMETRCIMFSHMVAFQCCARWKNRTTESDARVFFLTPGLCTRSCRLDREFLEIKSTDKRSHMLVCVHLMAVHRPRTRAPTEEARQQRKVGRSSSGATREVAVAVAVNGKNLCGIAADVGRDGRPSWLFHKHSMAFCCRAAEGCCVPALLKKPREFGLGSCDHAWRGHFSKTFM